MKYLNALIGVSLSEPHTSVTSLRTCVCMLAWTDHLPQILNEHIQIFHEDRACEGQIYGKWSVQASIHTHVRNEVTLVCMGLAQACPNN